jgi:acyl-coenzyme A thioesterase PaaI-like protein
VGAATAASRIRALVLINDPSLARTLRLVAGAQQHGSWLAALLDSCASLAALLQYLTVYFFASRQAEKAFLNSVICVVEVLAAACDC